MPKTNLNIDVLGSSLHISVEEEPEYLNRLLELYKQKLEETRKNTGLTDSLKTAILTGFILYDELEKARQTAQEIVIQETEYKLEEAESLTLKLISQLDEILENKSKVFKLKNTIKNYDWGSPDWIPKLLDEINEEKIPFAELWMGVHPEGPSEIISQDGTESFPLPALIAEDPPLYLGEEGARNFGSLPFLFKILAAAKPLSIQAHPNSTQAREGWERENRYGIDHKSPSRNYKDPNHKPEILCALSPFTVMVGFRQKDEIKSLLEDFLENTHSLLKAAMAPLFYALEEAENPLKAFLLRLFQLPLEVIEALGNHAAHRINDKEQEEIKNEWMYIADFAEKYPGDPAIIAPLYLNLIDLNPGEAIYLPAGILHSYIYGLGIELMANSDNVLRGGLTSKHMDLDELFNIINFNSYIPSIIKETGDSFFHYPVPCQEFSLSVIHGGELVYPETGPSIVLVTRGELSIRGKGHEILLKKGESAFIAVGNGDLIFDGDYTVYLAGIGLNQDI